MPALLDHVAFLLSLIHDLKEDSSAYRRGVEEERRRIAANVETIRKRHGFGVWSMEDVLGER